MIELVSSTGPERALQVIIPFKVCGCILSDAAQTGRGVLIDYASWAEKRGINYTTFSTHQVKLTDILEIAKENNITFKKGDILLVRVGVTKEWDTSMTDAQKQAYSDNPSPEHAGVEATTEVLRFLWDTGFAAIAGDAISWEVSGNQIKTLNILPYCTWIREY
jgi:kynurenine formamidase